MNVLESFSLKGKTALVTGGAGLFGRQITEALAEAGAQTFIADCDMQKQETQIANYFRPQGLEIQALQYDQGDERSIQALLQTLIDRAGGVDVLINNAVLRVMPGWGSPAETFAKSMAVNATGIFLMTRAFGDHMAARGHGSIVNVGSMQGMIGPDFNLYEGNGPRPAPDYFIHKGGVLQLTRYAAAQLGPRGVRVNTVCPGGFFNNQHPQFLERYYKHTYLGRMANMTDLKGVMVFLASEASAYVTGASIVVDGGYTVN